MVVWFSGSVRAVRWERVVGVGRGGVGVGRELVELDARRVERIAIQAGKAGPGDVGIGGLTAPGGGLRLAVGPDLEIERRPGDAEPEPLQGGTGRTGDTDTADVGVNGAAPLAEELNVAGCVESDAVISRSPGRHAQNGAGLVLVCHRHLPANQDLATVVGEDRPKALKRIG